MCKPDYNHHAMAIYLNYPLTMHTLNLGGLTNKHCAIHVHAYIAIAFEGEIARLRYRYCCVNVVL